MLALAGMPIVHARADVSCVYQDQPGRYWLQYVLKVNVGKQRITIVPDGYRMCGQIFSHPDQLINWFKKNHRVSPLCLSSAACRLRVGLRSTFWL